MSVFFFFNDTAPTEIYTLSLHDALPICTVVRLGRRFHLAQSGNLRDYVLYLILSIMLGLLITIPFAMGWVDVQAIVGSS